VIKSENVEFSVLIV